MKEALLMYFDAFCGACHKSWRGTAVKCKEKNRVEIEQGDPMSL
jgi:hypothetical protein